MTRLEINGLSYHIEEFGSGTPVVMLHGFTGSTETWRPVMSTIGRAFRSIAIDLPGHGQSDAPLDINRYRMERIAGDLARLLERLAADPAHWLGYSMGGRLALYMACRHPELVRSVVLESASPGLREPSERETRIAQDMALANRIENEGILRFVDYWQSMPLFDTQKHLPEKSQVALRQQRLNNSATGLANSLRGMGTGAQPALGRELGNLAMPVMLIAGEKDEKFVSINRQMAAAIPQAKLALVAGSGHAVHLEAAHQYSDLVINFLTASSKSGREYLTEAKEGYENQRSQ